MKAETVLDFVELQLAPPRTRCELFVSANGVTEKLASGFLKPFLTHVQEVEEQVARGCSSVRLGHPQSLNGKSWFTKGTVERFVRFVSTPEVLERVKSVEDELAQLKQVRSIQASSLSRAENISEGPDEDATRIDKVHLKVSEKKGNCKLPRRNDGVVDMAEASKVELLRAMDLRLLALQQEQTSAFERAGAAGFSRENMADLVAFSDHFGADRLRTACVNFLDMLKTRDGKSTQLDSKAVSNFSSSLLHGVPGADEKSCQHFDRDLTEASHAFDNERIEYGESALTSVIKRTSFNNLSGRGSGGVEVRKRWGPPENIRTELFRGRNETDSVCSSESSNGASLRGSPEVQSLLEKKSIEQDMNQKSNPLHSLSSAQGGDALSAGYMNTNLTHMPDDQADGEFLSMEGRSSMPLPNIPNDNFSSQEASVKEKSRAVDLSCKSCEGSEALSTPVAAPTRRLSVQDAISLFENKQRRDSFDSVGKPRNGKQENASASLEGAGASLSGSVALKRWDSEKSLEAEENGFSSKPEVGGALGTSFTSASRLEVSGGFSNDSLQGRQGHSLSQSISGGLTKSSNKPSTHFVPAKIGATSIDQCAWSETEHEVCDGDWRKQFKLQLEKSLAQDCFRRDLLAEGDLAERELGINILKQTPNHSRIDVGKDIGPSAAIPFVGSRPVEAAEYGVLVESRQLPPGLNRWQNGSESSDLGLPSSKRTVDVKVKEDGDTDEVFFTSESATKQKDIRESLGSSLVNALDHNMHATFVLADNQTDEEDKGSSGSKGRLYEQYKKLRDAKLMEDQDSKRVEREAKLRMMEETLRRRKAEMDARAVRLSKNGRNQARSSTVEVLESDLHTPKKEQQDGDLNATESVEKDKAKSTISSISPPLTPCTSKEVSTLKPQSGRKAGAVPQKGATPPRSAGRTISSVSPKVTPRSTPTGAGNVQKATPSSRGDNPLARSVPCFANLRKENTKPLPGRQQGSARVHPKNGAIGRDTLPLEANSNVPVRTNFSRSGPSKEEQRTRSALLRKSYATVNDLKLLSTSSDDGVLAPRRCQKELTAEPPTYNNLRRSTASSLQEAKPFLRKGRGIGRSASPLVIKQKVLLATITTKSSDQEIVAAQRPEVSNTDGASQGADAVLDGGVSRELSESENMDVQDDDPETFVPSNHVHVLAIRTADSSQNEAEDGSTAVDTPTTKPLLGTLDDTQGASHTISSPIDINAHNPFADVLSLQLDSNVIFDPDALSLKEEDTEPLSQYDEDTVGSIQNQHDEVSASGSFCAASPSYEHSLPGSSPVPPSQPSSSVAHQEQFSATFGAKLESPLGSPATWISSQVHHTDVTQLDKKWVAFQKPVMASQPKESVKGFKRLLKFARMSRSSEVSAADCISASTTSEGDDEAEEQSRFVDEVSSRIRLSERRYNDLPGNHSQAEGEIAAQSLRSSIPTPPANFKIRDDHMGGGTMLKAPRSFFSLSSFRSKGSEAKSRYRDYGHA